MSDFLTALKAAHEMAAPRPWVGAQRVSVPPGMYGSQARSDSHLAVLLVNAAPELAALVERLAACEPDSGERCPLCLHDAPSHGEECPFAALAAIDARGVGDA